MFTYLRTKHTGVPRLHGQAWDLATLLPADLKVFISQVIKFTPSKQSHTNK